MSEENNIFQQISLGAQALGLSLADGCIEKLIAFITILLKWNKVYNLTSITDLQRIVTHHILDSLSIVPYIKGSTVIDVGSGGGFPGIPCALALPEKRFTLLDSNGKKIRFLIQAIGELGISNAIAVQSRAEDYHPEYCFDTVTVRAFAPIEKAYHMTKHLLCPQGISLLMKGVYPQEELNELPMATFTVHQLHVPNLAQERHLVCIKG